MKIGDTARTEAHGVVSLDDYAKGWWTITDANDEAHKVRAKDLLVILPGFSQTRSAAGEPEEDSEYKIAGMLRYRKDRYVRGLGETAKGNATFDIGDDVADALRGLSIDDCYEAVADDLTEYDPKTAFSKKMAKEWEDSDREWCFVELDAFLNHRYQQLNPGMQRMNLGNVLRGARRRLAKQAVAA